MRDVRAFAIAIAVAASVIPAEAMSAREKTDCEQVKNPGLKVSACTRILAGGSLSSDLRSFGHYHRGLGLLLQQNFDRAIVEFNEALRADPTNIRALNSRGNAWRGKGELDNAIAERVPNAWQDARSVALGSSSTLANTTSSPASRRSRIHGNPDATAGSSGMGGTPSADQPTTSYGIPSAVSANSVARSIPCRPQIWPSASRMASFICVAGRSIIRVERSAMKCSTSTLPM